MAWWNIAYPFKKALTIDGPVTQGHPILVSLPGTTNKMRSDFNDVEVVYTTNDATPVMRAIPRDTFLVDGTLYVRFAAQVSIVGEDTSYAVYFGNKALVNVPVRSGVSPNVYAVTVTPTTGLGLSFVRPNEDWSNGVSLTVPARATFAFTGIDARLVMEKGPDRGVAVLKLDNEPEFQVDLFASTASQVIVWSASGLAAGKHNLRIRTDGNKAPASTSSQIKIVSGQYSPYVEAETSTEEINGGLGGIRIMVGV